jgi:hypothetical protein
VEECFVSFFNLYLFFISKLPNTRRLALDQAQWQSAFSGVWTLMRHQAASYDEQK